MRHFSELLGQFLAICVGVLVGALIGVTGVAAAELDPAEVNQGVVKITSHMAEVGDESGTGLAVHIDGEIVYILTAYHVVAGAESIEVEFHSDPVRRYEADLYRFDEPLDIAVIFVEDERVPTDLPSFTFAAASHLEEASEVAAIGHQPGDLDWQLSRETVTNENDPYDPRKFLFTKGAIERGNSGGPIFSGADLVGIVTSKKPTHAVAVKMEYALVYLEQWRVSPSQLVSSELADKPAEEKPVVEEEDDGDEPPEEDKPAVTTVEVPSVVRLRQEQAEASLKEIGLRRGRVFYKESTTGGFVLDQSPRAGTVVGAETEVDLTVSRAPAAVEVPSLSRLQKEKAEAVLARAGLRIGSVSYKAVSRGEGGTVVSQSPRAGTRVSPRTTVDLVLSRVSMITAVLPSQKVLQLATGALPKGVYTIRQKSNNRYVDAHEHQGEDYRLVTRPAQNNDTQRWILTPLGNNVYTIRQKSNNRYVDAHEHQGEDYRLVTRPAQNNDTQKWILKPLGNNTYTIRQKSNNRYVDAHEHQGEDYRLVTRPAQNNDTQRWVIKAQ